MFGAELALGGGGAYEDDFCAEGGGGVELDLRGVRGHDDDGFGAEGAGGEGDSLGVVAGGVGDDAEAELVGGELGDFVVGAAEFEAADGLGGLVLEVDVGGGVGEFGEAGHAEAGAVEADERGADGGAGDAMGGGLDVGEGDEGHGDVLIVVGGGAAMLSIHPAQPGNRTCYETSCRGACPFA